MYDFALRELRSTRCKLDLTTDQLNQVNTSMSNMHLKESELLNENRLLRACVVRADLNVEEEMNYTRIQEKLLKSNTIETLLNKEQEFSESSEAEPDVLPEVEDKDQEGGPENEVTQLSSTAEEGSKGIHLEHTDDTIEPTEEVFEELYNKTEVGESDDDQEPTVGEASITTTDDLAVNLEQDDDDHDNQDDIYDSDVSDTEE